MKRFVQLIAAITLLAVAFYSPPASAQNLSGTNTAQLVPMPVTFHNTTAGTGIARNPAWNAKIGYADSTVFRHASALPTSYDTSTSYPLTAFPFPPTFGPAYIPSIADTLFPWIVVKFAQDTVSYIGSPAGTSAMDSVRVWMEFSNDQVNWYTATGTPTYRFDVVFATSGADGLQSPTLIGVELLPGSDDAMIPIKARLNQTNGASALILNSVAAGQYSFVRFIFGGDYIGQFKADILRWGFKASLVPTDLE